MSNEIICDICMRICWDDGDKNEVNIYSTQDVCDICYVQIGDFVKQLKENENK